MPPPDPSKQTAPFVPGDCAAALVEVLDQYLADLQAGKRPSQEKILAAHPQLAPQLAQCLSGIEFIQRASEAQYGSGQPAPSQLGDFRLIDEVGRGGMGVVYQAEQISLRRRVALKVLRFGASPDAKAAQRFQREAETVGQLHHTNIAPIFASGCENGVYYYAMQFIEGNSLAEVGDRAAQSQTPLPAAQIAQWGLEAAEALTHAHQRNVIHRDVKPSNLMLDLEGRIWLTDFGLAKRLDDVTLSMAGALLGTPRYMSPEQARAAEESVDHRTDIYSLGATLYELAVGQPIFRADTPQGVIEQVLSADPPPPRTLQSDLPRDLETIILKSLAKEPQQRYDTAAAMAEDLRALLENRPIRARRPTLRERAQRWLRRRRRMVTAAALSAAAAALLVLAILFGLRYYEQSQSGQLTLTATGPQLVAEVLDKYDVPVHPAFPVPASEPVSLPAGSYQLRLSTSGLPSVTFPLVISRGGRHVYPAPFSTPLLWPPREAGPESGGASRAVQLFQHAQRTDLLELIEDRDKQQSNRLRKRSFRLVRGDTGQPQWRQDFEMTEQTAPQGFSASAWRGLLNHDEYDPAPHLLQPAPDLDGDGFGDLVWACRRSPTLLTISGQTGRLLWLYHALPEVGDEADRAWLQQRSRKGDAVGQLVGTPAAADVDGDGGVDLIACFASRDRSVWRSDTQKSVRIKKQFWMEAVSGQSGKMIWRRGLDFSGLKPIRSSLDEARRNQLAVPQLSHLNNRPALVMIVASHLAGFDLRNGELLWPPHQLGVKPVLPPQVTDLDGDEQSDVLIVHRGLNEPEFTMVPWTTQGTLSAIRLTDRQQLWQKPVTLRKSKRSNQFDPAAHLVIDLNGDGRAEIVLPTPQHRDAVSGRLWRGLQIVAGADGKSLWTRPLSYLPALGVTPLDRLMQGPFLERLLTGEGFKELSKFIEADRQQKKLNEALFQIFGEGLMASMGVAVHGVLTGPDLDGDGWADIFTAWRMKSFDNRQTIYVAALSGRDGRRLWQWDGFPNKQSPSHQFAGAMEHGLMGKDGHRELIVHLEQPSSPRAMAVCLQATTGRAVRILPDADRADGPAVADFNGDGLWDWMYYVSPQGAKRMMALQGELPDTWRRLENWIPAGDLDGDLFPDFLQRNTDSPKPDSSNSANNSTPQMRVISGKTGKPLWQTAHDAADHHYVRLPAAFAAPGGDFDGDGIVDVVAVDRRQPASAKKPTNTGFTYQTRPLTAFSGRSGKRLWTSHVELILGSGDSDNSRWRNVLQTVAVSDVKGEGQSDLLVGKRGKTEASLIRISGAAGKVLWKLPVARGTLTVYPALRHANLGDLNGDGVFDVAAWTPAGPETPAKKAKGYSLQAFDGKDGSRLWKTSNLTCEQDSHLPWPEPCVGDMNGDGFAEVIAATRPERDVVVQPRLKGRARVVTFTALDGRTGEKKWEFVASPPLNKKYEPILPPLMIDAETKGHRFVAIGQWKRRKVAPKKFDDVFRILVLDERGKVRKRIPVVLKGDKHTWSIGKLRSLWSAADIDGDGDDELLFVTAGKLCAWDAKSYRVLWRWPLPDLRSVLVDAPFHDDRLPRSGANPAKEVVIWSGHALYGLSAKGRPAWRCDVRSPPNLWSRQGMPVRLFYREKSLPPRVWLDGVLRQAWPVGENGKYLALISKSAPYPVHPADAAPQRRLPWVPFELQREALVRQWWIGFAAWCVVFALGYWGWRAARRKKWRQVALAAVLLIAAMLIWGWLFASGWWSVSFPLLIALPGTVYLLRFLSGLIARRWKRLSLLIVMSLLAALVLAAIGVWLDRTAQVSWNDYGTEHWYWILFFGASLCGLLVIVAAIGQRILKWSWKRMQSIYVRLGLGSAG